MSWDITSTEKVTSPAPSSRCPCMLNESASKSSPSPLALAVGMETSSSIAKMTTDGNRPTWLRLIEFCCNLPVE